MNHVQSRESWCGGVLCKLLPYISIACVTRPENGPPFLLLDGHTALLSFTPNTDWSITSIWEKEAETHQFGGSWRRQMGGVKGGLLIRNLENVDVPGKSPGVNGPSPSGSAWDQGATT